MATVDLCGFRAERGTVTVEMRAQGFHYNPLGSVHGGTVIQRGRRTALAQAELSDESGRLVAHATSSCMIFS